MRTNDTDSLVIAMGCKQFYDNSLKLWLQVGIHSKKNNQVQILVLVRHVKNLVDHYAMRYQLFMPLHGVTMLRNLKGEGKSHFLSC